MSDMSRVTVLMITYRRPYLLKRAVRSVLEASQISRVSGDSLELRILVNGTDTESEKFLEKFSRSVDFTVSWSILEKSVQPGEARNLALEGVSSDWILFLDDDAALPSSYFEEWEAAVREFPDAGILGGPNLSPQTSSHFQKATGDVLASRLATYFSRARYAPVGDARYAGEESLIRKSAIKEPKTGFRRRPLRCLSIKARRG